MRVIPLVLCWNFVVACEGEHVAGVVQSEGRPVADAELVWVPESGRGTSNGITDRDGRFILDLQAFPGDLTIRKAGFLTKTQRLERGKVDTTILLAKGEGFEFDGIGISVGVNNEGKITVEEVFPCGTAIRAGVRAGDVIDRINDFDADALTVFGVRRHLGGQLGSRIQLSLAGRPGFAKRDVEVERIHMFVPCSGVGD
jgi:hypothetical protein